jgi:methyl-accepting chemotaxis protein
MNPIHRLRLNTIRGTLVVGFTALVTCLVIAGATGWIAVRAGARDVASELSGVLTASEQTSGYANIITREIQAASSYLATRDSASLREFHRLGHDAHQLQRRFGATGERSAAEIAAIAAVDNRLAEFESTYALAHRLNDLGRTQDARAAADRAQRMVDSLLGDLARFDAAKSTQVVSATARLDSIARWRATTVLAAAAIAALIAILIALRTTRAIDRPLRALIAHARHLSEGDLTIHTEEHELPGEFETLARAMNHAAESLARVVEVATRTADDVTHSAGELATASQQIADTANQVSEAVTQVSVGAETQVAQISKVTRSLESIRDGADGVAAGAEEVQALAAAIHGQAVTKREELERTLAILFDVRNIVRQAAEEVRALNATVGDINKFVTSVGRIADQTNLLSLNAAIEAARAGAAGRGFGVVADEIRKLADQSRAAADDVVQLTGSVTSRVAKTYSTMERGESHVGEIERVSRQIDEALAVIAEAAERTTHAANTVARTADDNVRVVRDATDGLGLVAQTAESHAATAMQVSASTEEQSAACVQMTTASALLLRGSTHLRGLVGELKTA